MQIFRSKFEADVRGVLPPDWAYEERTLPYTVDHNYTPDYTKGNVCIEVKGRFRDNAEARKYVEIREQHPEIELVFLFMKPSTPMPHAKKRKKCGTKRTHREWAEYHGFKWYTIDTIGEIV